MINENSARALLSVPTPEEMRKREQMIEATEKYETELKEKGSAPVSSSQESIAKIMDAMKDLLLYKNKMYGDSALKPIGIFTKHIRSVPVNTASILVHLDDKLGRVRSAPNLRINDVSDIIGYCTLLLISMGATKKDIEKFKD